MAEDAHVPITEATMVATGTKHDVATGGMSSTVVVPLLLMSFHFINVAKPYCTFYAVSSWRVVTALFLSGDVDTPF